MNTENKKRGKKGKCSAIYQVLEFQAMSTVFHMC